MATAIPTEQGSDVMEIAYQKYEGATPQGIVNNVPFDSMEVAYQQYEVASKVPLPTLPWNLLKITTNVVYVKYVGAALSYDGATILVFPAPPAKTVWPRIISLGSTLYLIGGLTQTTTVNEKSYVYGKQQYVFRNYSEKQILAMVSPSSYDQTIYLVDDKGNTVVELRPEQALLLRPMWAIVSSKPFTVVYQTI